MSGKFKIFARGHTNQNFIEKRLNEESNLKVSSEYFTENLIIIKKENEDFISVYLTKTADIRKK